MKAAALRADIQDDRGDDDEESETLRDELTEKTTMLNRMHTELERKNKTISHLESELNAQSTHSQEVRWCVELFIIINKCPPESVGLGG